MKYKQHTYIVTNWFRLHTTVLQFWASQLEYTVQLTDPVQNNPHHAHVSM